MKHTPLIRLQNARIEFGRAQLECPHWDYESDGDHDCCYRVQEARRELQLAKKACSK